MKNDVIKIKGAKENNLKNIDLEIPKNKLVIMSGVSGSGKTSLAFDTIYAEGQRRYMESLSSYARQFLGNSEKPNVESIDGLSPAISIDQKTTHNNPRSTVGTVTEIYDYLRLLYARVGKPYCPNHNELISSQTIQEMVERIMLLPDRTRIVILAPLVNNKKGTHKELLDNLLKQGYIRIRHNSEIKLIEEMEELEKNKKHTIDVVIDRLIKSDDKSRLYDSLESALKIGNQMVIVSYNDEELLFSSLYACNQCGFSVPVLEPRLFSFNSPLGACATCNGLGFTQKVDIDFLIPDKNLSINDGGIVFYKNIIQKDNLDWQKFKVLAHYYKVDLDMPIKDIPKKQLDYLLYGSDEVIRYELYSSSGTVIKKLDVIEGVVSLIERRYQETTSNMVREWLGSYMSESTCPTCLGKRLNDQVLSVKVGELNIAQVCHLAIKDALIYFEKLELSEKERKIAELILKEIKERLGFLNDVGLNYLSLDRLAGTLSGGEAQRIRLATQIGSKLTGVLYVLDEPSIGLHQRDNDKLITTLKHMRDLGNTLIVVEHDEDTMRESDYIIDIGPKAGMFGGEVMAVGTPDEVGENPNSITGKYLSGKLSIAIPENRRKGNGSFIEIRKASENNLKNVNVSIPLNTLTVVSGVSGSGKSSLVNEVLAKGVQAYLGKTKVKPGKHKEIVGLENIDKLIEISQDPIGRTPRSNPATYTGVFDDIRDLYALTPASKMKGFDKGRFSFNVKGGRCEACQGDGITKISMHFLPDVYVDCEVCKGKRYTEDTLTIEYKGKNIYDVLNMSVDEAVDFFDAQLKIQSKIKTLQDVGLGYIKLGQSATTLSGGEAQRVKLASELSKKSTGKTLFVLDEPTTGLHSDDVKKLIHILQTIVDKGDTIVVIEHNLDVIKSADFIIDIGPEGGDLGGEIIAIGTPEKIAESKKSYTGKYLKKILK